MAGANTMASSGKGLVRAGGPSLVLASRSAARAALLRGAAVPFTTLPAAIDERALATGDAVTVAGALATAKAQAVSREAPGALVIGADQVLDLDGRRFDKPASRDAARADLRALRGRVHMQVSAVCVVKDGRSVWSHTSTARLAMRAFSDDFLERYLALVGDDVCQWVGGYALEGPGVHLFERVEGDYFTVLGLPLLPLLAELRALGVLET